MSTWKVMNFPFSVTHYSVERLFYDVYQ